MFYFGCMIEVIKITANEHLKQAWAIRKKVFVEEQNCPENIEWEFEEESTHFLAIYDSKPCGTARWRKADKGIKLERFAVLKTFRNKNIGANLLKAVLADTPINEGSIYLHAQITAKGFYLKNGFKPIGEHFWEADIEHVKMQLVL
jgi:predicted GNAT family N-acyltransferase